MASKQQQKADQEFDPKYEWQENAANFLLRLHLSGFRKEDFRVQVDRNGCLTVRGQRADAGNKHLPFHKVFQLPPTSDLDNISGRFDASVLTLTVPKRPAPPPPPATIDDIRKPTTKQEPKTETKMPPPPPQVQPGDKDEANKAEEKPQEHIKEEFQKPKEELRKKAAAAEEELRNKAAAAHERIKEKVEATKTSKPPPEQQKEDTTKADTKPPQAQAAAAAADKDKDKDKHKESLLETARRRAEEEKAKAAAAEAEEARRLKGACGGWKQRVAEELHGLRTSDWAEGAVDTVKKNKEVIAAAVAAFSLGLLVSCRLFSRRN